MEGNCRKGFAVVWFYICLLVWNGSQNVLMLEDNGPYLLLSALSLFLLLDLFADLLPCLSSGRYFSPVSTPPLLEDQLLGSWNWPTTTLGHLFHTPELCQKDWGHESFLSMVRTCYRNGKPSFQILCWHFLNDRPACQTKAKMEDEKIGKTLVNIRVDSLEPHFLDLVWISPEQRCWFQLLDCQPLLNHLCLHKSQLLESSFLCHCDQGEFRVCFLLISITIKAFLRLKPHLLRCLPNNFQAAALELAPCTDQCC